MSNADYQIFEDIIQEMMMVYRHDNRPWLIGYSGGKDSTLLVSLVFRAVSRIPENERNKKVYVITSDTMVENPIVKKYMHESSEKISSASKAQKLNIQAEIIYPDIHQTFWARVIGLGYPTPEPPGFRWCTERLKINPMNKFVEECIKTNGEIIILLGVRKAESAARSRSISEKEIAGYLLNPHNNINNAYGLDDLQAVLSGKKAHTPRKKIVTQAETQKVNLLVDIQAKLQAGKGAGYARWAKVFNLKQMAQTMNYLSEHNLLEYAVLEEKAAAATAHHNELSAHIKAAEKRMAEIAVLRTHIVNYAKTREVYVAYRKAGYSKKFREAHEEEILLHQAAKNAFDEMGVKKLPKVKELQTEYAKLLEEKKKTYSEYRRSREEMRELLTAKANVDRVLKMEVEQDVEKEKDHGQR